MVVANPDFGEEAKDSKARQRILKYRPGTKAETGDGGVLASFYLNPPIRNRRIQFRSMFVGLITIFVNSGVSPKR